MVSPLLQGEGEWSPFIDKAPRLPVDLVKSDSTDPGLEQSRKSHAKVDFVSRFATIEAVENQLYHGRFELEKQVAIETLLHLFEGR